MLWWIIGGLFLWFVGSVFWFMYALGRKHRKSNKLETVGDYFFYIPMMTTACVFGYVTCGDVKRDLYWIFAQIVRLILLPIVIPVRIAEWYWDR